MAASGCWERRQQQGTRSERHHSTGRAADVQRRNDATMAAQEPECWAVLLRVGQALASDPGFRPWLQTPAGLRGGWGWLLLATCCREISNTGEPWRARGQRRTQQRLWRSSTPMTWYTFSSLLRVMQSP